MLFFTDLATGNLYFGSATSPNSLPPSTYLINTDLTDPGDPAGGESDDVLIVQPETVISADTTITLDARQAHEITVRPPQSGAVGVFGDNAYTFLRTDGPTTTGFDYSFFAPTRIFTVGTAPVAQARSTSPPRGRSRPGHWTSAPGPSISVPCSTPRTPRGSTDRARRRS